MKLHTFTALPTTPAKLEPLLELASNMWFSWNWDVRQLFKRLDPDNWEQAKKNPIRMLSDISQKRLEDMAKDDDYINELQAVHASYVKYMTGKTWFEEQFGPREDKTIAYFSCEFGIHESLPIYSGGLGVLAGDHLKSASDLGVPLIAVGFLYRQGYFRQGLNADGMQQEFYPENDKFSMPVHLEKDENGKPILLSLDIGGDEVFYQIWRVDVGRIKLYLLDTNLHCNNTRHRDITKRLYEADRDTRLRQEILLGMGGVQALRALGHSPAVYHINEGHSAFLILERLRDLMENKFLSYDEAKQVVWATNIFTTHTPVPAGNERFDASALKKYLGSFVQKRLGLSWSDFLALGKEKPQDMEEDFCLTVLALNFSSLCNGVAKLHGEISRDMWKELYPEVPINEVPISHITNGVHTRTWLSKSFQQLFLRYMQSAANRELFDFTLWKVVDDVPQAELWHAHLERKKELIEYVRQRLRFQLRRRGASAGEINKMKNVLDPKVLTIGFARRFAPYKRGDLLFRDIERIKEILNDVDMPVQILFAGKAHPADSNGKAIIKTIADIAKTPEFFNRVVFLEDYDLDMARQLVQGVDVWLNNPRRPMEASGTSGMKAAMNGALNLSILDGWWDEAFDGTNGWAIGHGEDYDDKSYQDEVEANLLCRLIKNEVAPLYYDTDEMNIPQGWVEMMKSTIRSCGAGYNAHRMVTDYIKNFYVKAEMLHETLSDNDYTCVKELTSWYQKICTNWEGLEIVEVETPEEEVVYAGSEISITSRVRLGRISPEDVIVEVFHGILDNEDQISIPLRETMEYIKNDGDVATYKVKLPCNQGGRYGYTVRVLPGNENLSHKFIRGLIKWAE